MRIATWNVNGLRAAIRKGIQSYIDEIEPDVLLFQEIRSLPEQLTKTWSSPAGWHVHWHPAEKKGYAGVATWSRSPLQVLGTGMDADDPEGRILRCRSHGFQFINVYLPSGSGGPAKQEKKEAWMKRFLPWVTALAKQDEPIILVGDLNIAHTENDIHNPKGNKRTSGFLPHEREWFTQFLQQGGWTDVLRASVGEQKGPYSWWSNRGRARELDRGWRIDYVLANRAAAPHATGARIIREGGMTVSDHAPVVVEFSNIS